MSNRELALAKIELAKLLLERALEQISNLDVTPMVRSEIGRGMRRPLVFDNVDFHHADCS